jgi:hypothetical protein
MALPTSFDMCFAPTTRIVSVVRRFVLSLYERILEDSEVSAQLALATHELLENAVKYNIDDETLLRVSVVPQSESLSDMTVTIRTRNRATPENLHSAQRIITRVKEAQDPFLFYQELMMNSVMMPEGSGLGLARIRAETELKIDFVIDGDTIEIVAQTQLRFGGES